MNPFDTEAKPVQLKRFGLIPDFGARSLSRFG